MKDYTILYKYDKVQRYWAVAEHLSVEQWESVLISGPNNGRMTWSLTDTHRAAGSRLQTGEAASQSSNTAKKHLLIFLFPLPTSLMCFGTSGIYDSKVKSETLSTIRSTTEEQNEPVVRLKAV